MSRIKKMFLLPGLILVSGLLLLLRYVLRTPQPLTSRLPGDDHTYKWTYGNIFYKVSGKSDAPPLLLLHAPGIGASAHEMLPIMEHLTAHYRVYAPDLLGFGLSDAPDIDYNANVFIALCQDFLREVVQQPATVLASGLSCTYALAVASNSPELCSRLVLLSPPSPHRIFTCLNTRAIMNSTMGRYSWFGRMLAKSPLLGTFLYALLTPRIILRQIVRLQTTGRPGLNNDLNSSFAVAHQLGAQYAALAFVMGKLNLDITHENPSQPTLLLWNASPRINGVTQHYMSLPQIQTTFLSDGRYSLHASEARKVADAIFRWQNTAPKELPVGVGSETELSGMLPAPGFLSAPVLPEVASAVGEAVENSQPSNLKMEPVGTTVPAPINAEAFCVKCKQKRTMSDARRIVTKNGRNALEGICPICGTRLFRFISGQNKVE